MERFWQGKKVFITGHTGFKGSWLSLWLQLLKAQVIGFSLQPPTASNLFQLAEVDADMKSIIGDIRDFSLLKNTIQEAQPEIVIHMAAQSLVRYSYKEPVETYSTNVMGTVNLLEAIRHVNSIKVVINITTDKCYENKEWEWGYRENDRLGGFDPYSNSKACSELVTAAYRNSFFKENSPIGLATARAGNVIGGGDWAEDRLIPDIIRAVIKQQEILIRHPHATRPWQHVLEPLGAYLLLAQKLYESPMLYSESWNFGPNEEDVKTVSWIADYIVALLNNKTRWVQDATAKLHEANYLKLECAKAKAKLNWKPRWNLEKSLQETVNWYQAYFDKQNMRDITLTQIKNFIERAI